MSLYSHSKSLHIYLKYRIQVTMEHYIHYQLHSSNEYMNQQTIKNLITSECIEYHRHKIYGILLESKFKKLLKELFKEEINIHTTLDYRINEGGDMYYGVCDALWRNIPIEIKSPYSYALTRIYQEGPREKDLKQARHYIQLYHSPYTLLIYMSLWNCIVYVVHPQEYHFILSYDAKNDSFYSTYSQCFKNVKIHHLWNKFNT